MAGNHSRDKGARGELELAHLIGAKKISRMYSLGPDLSWFRWLIEVKRRKTNRGFGLPDQLLRGEAPIVALRADRGEWVICMRPGTLMEIARKGME